FRRDENLVGVAREIRKKGDGGLVLTNDSGSFVLLGRDNIAEQSAAGFVVVSPTGLGFSFDRLEHKVGGVNLTIGLGGRHSDHLALILKDQDMINLRLVAEIDVFALPG